LFFDFITVFFLAPLKTFAAPPAKGKEFEGLNFRIQVSVLDCTGCGVCTEVCPVKCLELVPLPTVRDEDQNWEYLKKLPIRGPGLVETSAEKPNVKASQFRQPFLEFSGACGGCGETPYVKLVTQV
jgi:pyruvate-ferredoxin/flavodoxin oxidoreductase